MTGTPADKLEHEVLERCKDALDSHTRAMRELSQREMDKLAASAIRIFEDQARQLAQTFQVPLAHGSRIALWPIAFLAGALGGASAALIVFLTLP